MLSLIFVVLSSIVCTAVAIHFLLHHVARVGQLRNIPWSAEPWPLFGNVYHFILRSSDLFQYIRLLAKKHKRFYRSWMFRNTIIALLEPDDIEVLLSSMKYIQKSEVYSLLHSWLKQGLLTSTGAKWQLRRKILTPTFHFNILQQFVAVFGEHSKKLVDALDNECKQETTNIYPYMTEVALHNICETAMGTNVEEFFSSKEYKAAIYRWGQLFLYRLLRPWLHPEFIFWRTSTGREMRQKLKIMHDFTRRVIAERKKHLEGVTTKEDGAAVVGPKAKRLAMLDLLLSASSLGENIDDDGIKEEVDTFTFEGHDTTSMGLSFALMCLANNPNVQEKAYKEISQIFGDDCRPASMQELNDMKYLEMCIKESLRLYPSVPYISRYITEPLPLSGCTIPAGVFVDVHIFDLHRKPDLYPDPEVYDPERFTPEECAKRHPFAYIPFSAGPRNCIGQKFAMLEIKSIISTILRRYTLEAVTKPEDLKFICDLVLRTSNPILVKFKRR